MQIVHNPKMPRSWSAIALSNLAIAAAIGVLLRFAFIEEIPGFEYKNWLQAHSHVAILGWVFLALFVLIVDIFIPGEKQPDKRYKNLFLAIQVSVWGMLVAFVLRGYWAVSIGFLTLHGLLSYLFLYRIWRDLPVDRTTSIRLLRTACVFYVVSTLALWAIPVLTAYGLKGSEYYYMAVQFFLHFQFNGWFIFAVLAMFFKMLESKHVQIPQRVSKMFFIFLVLSCILTYALAVAWSNPLPVIFIVNSAGVGIQFFALIAFCVMLYAIRHDVHRSFTGVQRLFIYTALGCFVLKIQIQTAIVVPDIAQVGYTIRNFVIGFMHLILLGVVTMGIFGFAFMQGYLRKAARPGAYLVLIGFLGVELLLFVQGILLWAAQGFMPYYYEWIFAVSAVILIGVVLMITSYLSNSKKLQIASRII